MKLATFASALFIAGILPTNSLFAAAANENKSTEYKADNTGKNQRDVKHNELTAQDQSSGKNDVEVTRSIRKALMEEKNLSTSAHNIKIIVAQNAITLKGPVKNSSEIDMVIAKAKTAAPNMEIVNQLEVIK